MNKNYYRRREQKIWCGVLCGVNHSTIGDERQNEIQGFCTEI